ncbi:putative SOS response-associated peptidase YedK [Lutibacter sp. Hel_I_33_5]|uniref:SOS response-associated peptidase n=1 Tax=Lutibacter sp. Hel_I_33_5 TaxID=1566289 RepID=UPI0011A4618B|nr:SOS response-associated peptidase [Lutibacter sp. Hel_I_33_5]TVZ56927.1 putative SOS response-associated peptidase YedK [Lutibacter sp. Hel_I_33_5]
MCYQTRLIKKKEEIQERFNIDIQDIDNFDPTDVIKAFDYPKTPVITCNEPNKASLFNWGLIPSWSSDTSHRHYTLNARIETLNEKRSFKDVIQNRCLIIANGFYEWKWLNKSGTKKEKYLITIPNEDLFAFAGIYSSWTDMEGQIIHSYSIVTTQANEFMSKIHNTKKRMPVILKKEDESFWLNGDDYKKFGFPYEHKLISNNLDFDNHQLSIF